MRRHLTLDPDHAWGEFVGRLGWVDEGEFRRRNDEFFVLAANLSPALEALAEERGWRVPGSFA